LGHEVVGPKGPYETFAAGPENRSTAAVHLILDVNGFR
jgi:hypothetical protein